MADSPDPTATRRARHFVSALVVLLGSVGCDQVTKVAAMEWLRGQPATSYAGDTFRLTYMENRGAFLGMGSDWPEPARWFAFSLMSSILVGIALAFVVRRIRQSHDLPMSWAIWGALLLAAGGVGNLIDRFMRDGAVVDFMNMGLGSLRTGIFNVADVQIMVGAALVAFSHEARNGPADETKGAPGKHSAHDAEGSADAGSATDGGHDTASSNASSPK